MYYDSYDYTAGSAWIAGSTSFLIVAEESGTGLGATFSAENASENLDSSITAGAVLTIGGIVDNTSGDSSEGGGNGDIWIIGPFRNNIPYTRVEKHATRSFNKLHPNSKISNKQPFITMDTKETYKVVSRLFANKSREQILEDLEVLERVLVDEKEQRYKAERVFERV